jgi:2,5-diketo-D-gluconate reductase A
LANGRVRAVGVSNFMPDHMLRLMEETSVVPAVNRIEVHPYFRQSQLLTVNASILDDAAISEIAAGHGKTPAQVMLRWHLQQGRQVIPKSVTPSRIAENFDVLDFELTADELAAVDALDTGVRGGPEPGEITRQRFGIQIPEA